VATVVQDKSPQEAVMIRRNYLLHYRLVNHMLINSALVATALLLSYLILWERM
jgi:hypothetical protein